VGVRCEIREGGGVERRRGMGGEQWWRGEGDVMISCGHRGLRRIGDDGAGGG